jgi:hypothetical protein
MKNLIKDRIQLFISAFIQVMLVSMNVSFISNNKIVLMLITSFFISYFWSSNVKKVAFGGFKDKMIYCTGATLGCLIGYLISSNI